MRTKAKSLAKITIADPGLKYVNFLVGRNNMFIRKKLLVSFAMVSEVVSYEGMYYSDTADSLDTKINMFVKNSHFINIDKTLSMKDNVAMNTLLYLRYYLRYKHQDLSPVDKTKNVPLARLS